MKKHMKKAVAALLAAMMLIGAVPLGSLAEEMLEIVEIFQDFTGESAVEELEIVQDFSEEAELEETEIPEGFDAALLKQMRASSACGHVNLYVEEQIESQAYTSLGKEKHLYSYRLASRSLCCSDCSETLQTVAVNETITETGSHDWNSKGNKLTCRDCGAAKTVKYPCSHKKLNMMEDGNLYCPKCNKSVVVNKAQTDCQHSNFTVWEPNQSYVSSYNKVSDQQHLKTSITPIYDGEARFAECNDCGIWLEVQAGAIISVGITDTVYVDVQETSILEDHTLENGICIHCEQYRLSNTLTLSGNAQITAGKTAKFTVTNAEGKAVSAGKLTWTSSDKRIASVSKGVVTAKKAGTITLSAADAAGNFDSVVVTVLPKAKSVSILYNGADAGKTIGIDMNEITGIQLSASTAPEAAADAVTWKSSNKKVAKVDADGKVAIIGKGKAIITATAKDGSKKADTVTLNVAAMVKTLNVTGAAELTSGKTAKLKAEVTPAAASKAVTWKSSNKKAATVNEKGVVTAKKVSERTTVIITATAKDGSGVVYEHAITICPKASKVNILYNSADAGKIIGVDISDTASIQLSASTEPADAADAVTWKSSNKKVAKVDADGKVSIIGKGKAIITATAKDGSKKADTVTLNVAAMVKTLNVTGAAELTSGKTAKLKVQVTPTGASKAVTWKSGNTKAATVSAKGVVTAKKVSERTAVVITATAKDGSGVVFEHTITICPAPASVVISDASGAAIKKAQINVLDENPTLQLTASVKPADAAQTVTWKSSDKKIAEVDSTGKVTAKKKGSATITATAANGKKASCVIKVVKETPPAAAVLEYSLIDGGCSISAYTGTETTLEIPKTLDGKPVIAISDGAFKDCAQLTSIQLPDSITSIGAEAFSNCDGIKTIEIPKGVTEIRERTFYGCDSLETVYISDDVRVIGAGAFAYCKKLSVMEPR